MGSKLAVSIALICAVGNSTSVIAQETTTITYDALGRVVKVQKSGGPSNGVEASYEFDAAGNRVRVKVEGSANWSGGSGGGGATAPSTVYIVVPLNGFTLIPIVK